MAKYYMTVDQTVFMRGVNNFLSISLRVAGADQAGLATGGRNRPDLPGRGKVQRLSVR